MVLSGFQDDGSKILHRFRNNLMRVRHSLRRLTGVTPPNTQSAPIFGALPRSPLVNFDAYRFSFLQKLKRYFLDYLNNQKRGLKWVIIVT